MISPDRSSHEREHFDRLADKYGDHWWGNRTAAGQARQDSRASRFIDSLDLRPGNRVLELGCGAGDFTFRIAPAGADLAAMDISPKLVMLCKERSRSTTTHFCVGDAGKLAFQDNQFDAVVGNSVLHHLDLAPVLRESYRVLCPGGSLLFTEPNLLNPQIIVEKKVKPIGRYFQNSPDETAFIRWRLADTISSIGFEDVSVRPFDFLHPATPAFMIGAMHRIGAIAERLPLLREIAGSLEISAHKPDQTEG